MAAMARTLHTEEAAEVEVLFANMDKLKILTKKIGSSLDKLDSSGRGVQSSIRPIDGKTGRLQVTNTNIAGVRKAIDKIRADLVERRAEEPIIRGGVRTVGVDAYIAALERTAQKLNTNSTTDIRANQQAVAETHELLGFGRRELQGLFQEKSRQDAQPIEPLFFLTKGSAFPTLKPEITSDLSKINAYMASPSAQAYRSGFGEPQPADAYVEARANYLQKSLHNLSTASITTVRKTDPTAIYRQGQSGIGSYCKAIEETFRAEYQNVSHIFALDQCLNTHLRVCTPALEEFGATLKELHNHVKANLATDCFLYYEVVDLVGKLSVRVDSINPDLKLQFQSLLSPVRKKAKYSLSQIIEEPTKRISNIMALPTDGSPLRTTFDVMERLQAMTGYMVPLGSLLADRAEGSTALALDNEALFANYMAESIDALLIALESKARTALKSPGVRALFLANNLVIIERYLKTPQFSLIPVDIPLAKLAPWYKKGIKSYVATWDELSKLCFVTLNTRVRPTSGNINESSAVIKGMSGKDRELVKDRFKQYNAMFEDLVARHKAFHIENEIRPEVTREISRTVMAAYAIFWDRYHDIDKGKGKHARYDKQQLNNILASM